MKEIIIKMIDDDVISEWIPYWMIGTCSGDDKSDTGERRLEPTFSKMSA